VAVHSDVSDAGSGIIISAAERTSIGTNTTNNTGSVAVHSDVSSAGSGAIITGLERTAIGTNTTSINLRLKKDGTEPMTGVLKMGNQRISSVGTATGQGDALNRGVGDARYLQKTGGQMAGILKMDDFEIHLSEFNNRISATGFLLKVDAGSGNIELKAGTKVSVLADLDMLSSPILNLPAPVNLNDAVRLNYVQNEANGSRYSMIADTVIQNTTTETNMLQAGTGKVGSLSFFSSNWRIGQTYLVKAGGLITTDGKQNITFRVDLGPFGSSSIFATAPTEINETDMCWSLELMITTRTLGSTGTIKGGGLVMFEDGKNVKSAGCFTTASDIVLDMTITNLFQLTAQWANANVNNILTVQRCTISRTY
jgi:hypothetical protein